MTTSRRSFLQSGAMATLCAGLYVSSPSFVFGQKGSDSKSNHQIPYTAKTEREFYFTNNNFLPYLKTIFRVQLGYRVTELTLVKVEDCTPRKAAGADAAPVKGAMKMRAMMSEDSQCFYLVFQAKDKLSNLQSIFPIQHDALGEFSLFLVETEDVERGLFYYTATINHLHP